jgi:hypothetical protein
VKRVYAELRQIDPNVVTSDDMFISLTHANAGAIASRLNDVRRDSRSAV